MTRPWLLLAAVTVAGCAGVDTAPGGSAAATPGSVASPASNVRVGLTEWSVDSSSPLLAPGRVSLTVTNAGTTGHDFVLEGAGTRVHTPVLQPGERMTLSVRLPPGARLRTACTVPGHASAGMRGTLQVAEQASTDR